MECLRIGQLLAYLLDAAMDISHIDIDFLDGLAVDSSAEAEHTVSSRVLRAYVDHEVIGFEHSHLLGLYSAVGVLYIGSCEVALAFVLGGDRVVALALVIILAQWIAVPVNAEEQAAHVGIIDEDDTEEVIDLTLEYHCYFPKVGHTSRGPRKSPSLTGARCVW